MQDLYCLSISGNKTRLLRDRVLEMAFPCSQELALQLPPFSLARRMREMRVRKNTWVFKVQAIR